MEEKIIKSYKGFNKDMKCRDFQYEVGKEYEMDGDIEVCERGFHACPHPLDVFSYYPPATSKYCEVEQGGKLDESESDKVCSSKIKIGAELTIRGLVKAAISYVRSRCTNYYNAEPGKPATAGYSGAATAGYSGAATAGSYGAATAGDSGAATAGSYGAATAGSYGAATAGSYGAATAGSYGAATAGDRGAATAGSYGAATAGDRGAATAGYSGAATAGSYGAATAGDSGAATAGSYGAATAGDRGAATAGSYGAATSRGSSSVGTNGLAVARGEGVKVKGGLGAILVIAEENSNNYDIKEWKAVVVDGETIKADTWYKLVGGKLVEVDSE